MCVYFFVKTSNPKPELGCFMRDKMRQSATKGVTKCDKSEFLQEAWSCWVKYSGDTHLRKSFPSGSTVFPSALFFFCRPRE